jgi:uncharacterized protein YycO
MKKLFLIWMTLLGLMARAEALELKVGDVILQPLKCWACSLIEAEEETIYSHVGVVVATSPEVMVAEAFSKVRKLSLNEYNQKTEPGQKLMVLRFRRDDLVAELQRSKSEFMKLFETSFEGALYDHDFRWNNFDDQGNEKLYCSELVSKLFQAFAGIELPIKRMHFEQNRESWMTYFRGNIPDQMWGNSPADIHRSDLFYEVGEL